MLVPVLLFAVGLVLLIKGGDWFVDGATGLARRFHIPEIIVGATVVSIGTTLPEVMVSATGALNGQGAMSYGNAIGSIICNTSLIAAITLAVRPAPVDVQSMKKPAPTAMTAAPTTRSSSSFHRGTDVPFSWGSSSWGAGVLMP